MGIRVIALVVLFFMIEIVLITWLSIYTGWQVIIGWILFTAVFGWIAGKFFRRKRKNLSPPQNVQQMILSQINSILLIAGTFFLIFPGLIGDLAGFLLLVPKFRKWLTPKLLTYFTNRMHNMKFKG